MVVLLKIGEFVAFETLLVSIPESIGLLLFGVGLVVIAVVIRSFLSREKTEKADEKVTKDA